MRRTAATTLLLLPVLLLLGGCDKFKAREHFHRANNQYNEENYKGALREYQKGLQLDPTLVPVWRSVGFSALALYRPGDEGPENKGYADTAVEAFQKYLQAHPEDQKIREYLVSTLMASKRYNDAIALLQEDAAKHPGDPKYQTAVINAMSEAGQLDRAYQQAVSTGTRDSQVFHTIGVTAWSKSYRNPPASVDEHRKLIDLGIQSLEKALQLQGSKPTMETLTYINLTWREKVKVEVDPFKQQEYIQTADKYRNQAMELRRLQREREKQQPKKPPVQGQQQGG